ncbi:ribosome biogenesis protein Nop6 [Schizosaccharomyces japonicus yFS275]|uniref:Ribosome biogenesis protein Nop6 n=1 Tax=Schizosaccharomyces japonicus (strain yFS275 / FY16936) TaxID=402676 RepID=B6K7A1_SCHJY|nr:ribosome biogenesis protein Nop6 [Schizosaccharomyces japonicus yFS275]EEB09405.1 ribosome biogenesis protein Nop6 [Schizosaccharomyces japonicus yFS275]
MSSDIKRRRVFIGGLSETIREEDLVPRLQRFGQTSNFEIVEKKQPVGTVHRFAYVDLESTDANWVKCRTQLTNVVFRGSRLKLEEAKSKYTERLKEDQKRNEFLQSKERVSSSNKKEPCLTPHATMTSYVPIFRGKEAKDILNTVTDSDVRKATPRKGWKKGPYGRAIALLRVYNKKTKQYKHFFPLGKNCLQKLWGRIDPKLDDTTAYFDEEMNCYRTYSGEFVSLADAVNRRNYQKPSQRDRSPTPDLEVAGVDAVEYEDEAGGAAAMLTEEQVLAQHKQEHDTSAAVLSELFGSGSNVEESVSDTPRVVSFEEEEFAQESADSVSNPLSPSAGRVLDVSTEGLKAVEVGDRVIAVKEQSLTNLFKPSAEEAESFSLFGGNDMDVEMADEIEEEEKDEGKVEKQKPIARPIVPVSAPATVSSMPMFFPTARIPMDVLLPVSKDSPLLTDQAIQSWWSANRLTLTRDWKKKRKDALKRQRRALERKKI